jgi:hypothetical protein
VQVDARDLESPAALPRPAARARRPAAGPNFEPCWAVRIASCGVGLDPRRARDERPAHAGRRRPLGLVERVEHDEAHFGLGRGAELLVALVVPVHDDLVAFDPARAANASSPSVETSAPKPSAASRRAARRSGTLSGCRAGSASGSGLAVGRARRQDRLLAVDDEPACRTPRELGRTQAPEGQLAVSTEAVCGKEQEHVAIVISAAKSATGSSSARRGSRSRELASASRSALGRSLVDALAVPTEDVLGSNRA